MVRVGSETSARQHPVLAPGSTWQLQSDCDAYSRPRGCGLATQVRRGRGLRLLQAPRGLEGGSRLRVRLLEDGYPCWFETTDLLSHARPAPPPTPRPWDRSGIETRLERVLSFAQTAMACANTYLWGGTLGPDYDCSGLVQSAFADQGIWLPRDAYLQERFCRPVAV
ncbi:MAG: NlpC/P60 family protein, partial [Cyanobium sp.]